MEDDAYLHNFMEVGQLVSDLALESLPPDPYMVALGAVGQYERDRPAVEFDIPHSKFVLVKSQWTGNMANLVTRAGAEWLAQKINGDLDHMLKLCFKHKALDLTWSLWPNIYRLSSPLVGHIDAKHWSVK